MGPGFLQPHCFGRIGSNPGPRTVPSENHKGQKGTTQESSRTTRPENNATLSRKHGVRLLIQPGPSKPLTGTFGFRVRGGGGG